VRVRSMRRDSLSHGIVIATNRIVAQAAAANRDGVTGRRAGRRVGVEDTLHRTRVPFALRHLGRIALFGGLLMLVVLLGRSVYRGA